MSMDELWPTSGQMKRLTAIINSKSSTGSQEALDATFQSILDGTNTSKVFRQWWPLSATGSNTKYERLSRFADMLSAMWADKKYTLQYYLPSVSTSSAMTPMDDLVGKNAAQLCYETTTPVEDWADEDPMTWYVRANALSLQDGTMNILSIEGIDADFDITGETAPVYTFSVALWLKKWKDQSYAYKSWATKNHGGYRPYAGDVGLDNKKRSLTWHPSFPGGLNSDGGLTSGLGLKPCLWTSATSALTLARKVTAYEGLWNDSDAIWVLDMWQLRHFNLENSLICEGCQSYNYQYRPALEETGVKRVLLTPAQAANLIVGSNMELGEQDGQSSPSNDRYYAYNYSICKYAKITSIESVTIEDTTYAAVYLDVDSTFNTTATCLFSTMPWDSGVTDELPGHKDGTLGGALGIAMTVGKFPLRVMGVEMMSGAYDIGLDPLYNVTNFANSKGDYAVYECRDSENLAGSITSDYVDTGITYTEMPQGWNYPKSFVDTDLAILFPDTLGGSTSGYVKSGFYGTYSAGVRCPWRYGTLNVGAAAGLACGNGDNAPGYAGWNGRPRLCGSGKKRGEWAGA